MLNCEDVANGEGLDLATYLVNRRASRKSVYYAIHTIVYVCEVVLTFRNNLLVKSSLKVYIPVDVNKECTAVSLKDVTMSLPVGVRNVALRGTLYNSVVARLA